MIVDEYRATLFKKKIRTLTGASWLRFYKSKGGCHLCLMGHELGQHNSEVVISRLRSNGIECKIERDIFGLYSDRPDASKPVYSINIPLDQAALPERKR